MTEGDYKKKSPKYNIIYTLQYRMGKQAGRETVAQEVEPVIY